MKKLITLFLMFTSLCSVSIAQDVYTVAGDDVSVFGSSWDASNDANTLILCEDGYYRKTYKNVNFDSNGSFSFKVVKNQNWDEAWPASNYVQQYYAGTYDFTIEFNPSNKNVECRLACEMYLYYQPKGGSWTLSESTYSPTDDGEYTIPINGTEGMYFALIPKGNAGADNKWTNAVHPNTTDGDYWLFIQHMGAGTKVGSGKSWYIAEAGQYTFTYNSKYGSFTTDASTTSSIDSEGWRTYSTGTYEGSNGYTISGDDVKAYYVSYAGESTATLNTIANGTVIPTKAGILLEGSGAFTVSSTGSAPTSLTGNLLVGSGSSEKGMSEISDAFIFADGANGLGFYKLDKSKGSTLEANRAYLNGSSIKSRAFIGFGDNETEGISEVSSQAEKQPIYNLHGVRTNRLQKGLNIIGDKKVLVK